MPDVDAVIADTPADLAAVQTDEDTSEPEPIAVCGEKRMRYTCLRVPNHQTEIGEHGTPWHAATDGDYMAYWRDRSIGVTLRRRPELDV